MSNFLAVATVTAALRGMLHGTVEQDVPGATAEAGRPDQDAQTPIVGVNIYLYQAAPSVHHRGADLPTRDSAGRLTQKPRVALDLYYLFSFYGDDTAYEPQRVLGSVVRTLHGRPLLDKDLFTDTVTAEAALLGASDLPQVEEPVRLTPLALSVEELSKVWSIFFQTPYALSAAYVASTVFVEGEDSPRRALPVRRRNIEVNPFRRVVIEQAASADGASAPIVLGGGTLVLTGPGLGSGIHHVRIGGAEIAAGDLVVTADRVEVPLTGGDLRPGVQGVQTFYPGTDRSNAVPVVIQPEIARDGDNWKVEYAPPEPVAEPDPEEPTFEPVPEGAVTVTLTTTVGKTQRAALYLNEFVPDPLATEKRAAYTANAEPRDGDGANLIFRLPPPKALNYLVRVEVDGAESELVWDEGAKRYVEPLLDLTGV